MTGPVFAQTYCSLAEVDDDTESLGSEREGKIFEKILSASNFLEKEIGWFLPVTMARKFNGRGSRCLTVPPLLSVSSILNYSTALTSDEYVLQPNGRHYAYGPYSEIAVAYGASFCWIDAVDGVEVDGAWGLYDHVKPLGATLGASQAADALTLQVSNGALVSPGMVVLIGSEAEAIDSTNSTPSAAVTTLGVALDGVSDVATLADGTKVNVGEIIRLELEQARVLDRNANVVLLQRGWNKTKRTSHLINTNVDAYRTFDVTRGVNGTSAAAHSNGAAISRQMVPADVKQLTLKIASRMMADSASGYKGTLGDGAGGTQVYLYILPKELEDIKRNYKDW